MTDLSLRIHISGASGFVGKALVSFLLKQGHQVFRLVRKKTDQSGCVFWDPDGGGEFLDDWESMDAIIHLAGENIAQGLWTRSKKKRILESREKGTKHLVSIIQSLKKPPRIFISASAIGYYGDGDHPVLETSPPGSGFLSQVCQKWEEASKPLENLGIRTVHARFGLILSAKGGFLKPLLYVFRLGLGGVS